jgi:hypothetical protein
LREEEAARAGVDPYRRLLSEAFDIDEGLVRTIQIAMPDGAHETSAWLQHGCFG